MATKTAMMELIELISYTSKDTFYAMEDSGFFKQLLEKEKNQIGIAFNSGRYWNNSWDGNSYYDEEYLKEEQQ